MENRNQFESGSAIPELSCSEFDALLSDALDGILSAASQRRFDFHRRQCPTCGPLFREASAGMNWLGSLEEVEVPANLVHNILAATTVRAEAAPVAVPKPGWKERLSGIIADVVAPIRVLVRQPRIALTTGMAMFSLTLSLNFAGVKLGDLRHLDLRPSAIKESATMRYYETSSRVVKYYENIRLVYEVESRLQELKRATSSEEDRPPSERKKTDNQKPDREEKQNYYSMEQQNVLLANGSPRELKGSNNLVCFAARSVAGKCKETEVNNDFVTAGLSRGLQSGEELDGAVQERRSQFGEDSTRSLVA